MIQRWWLIVVLLLTSCNSSPFLSPPTTPATCHYQQNGVLPDPACTPGALDRAVSQENLHQTICVPGYTRTVRPPTSYTSQVKDERLRAYGQEPALRAHYELDHLVPLELGGAPQDVRNLWPEPEPSYHAKDQVENKLHDEVCAGTLLLADAQHTMMTDWRQAQ